MKKGEEEDQLVNVYLTLMAGTKVKEEAEGGWYRWYGRATDLFVLLHGVTFLVRSISQGVPITERCISIFATINCLQIEFLAVYQRIYRREFAEAVDMFRLPSSSFRQHEEGAPTFADLVRDWTKVARTVPKVLLISECVAGGVWCMLPAVALVQSVHGGRFLVGPAWFPFDPLQSPAFEAVIAFQVVGAMLVSLKMIAFYDLLLNLGFRLVANFVYLRTVTLPSCLPPCLPPSGQQSRLKQFVHSHHRIIRMCHLLQKLYSPALLVHFFLQLIIICTSVFVFVKAKMDLMQMVFSFLYVATNTVKLFFICRMGDHLAFESGRLMESTAGTEWYAISARTKSSLKIIFSRSSKAFKLSALGVFPLTSETFRSILATAYSYYTFLDQMKGKTPNNFS